ncbi:MAG: phosphatase PAP2-related protein [Candidatus Pacearchaeota archaeon]|jgi:hypothetical protein
MAKIKFNYNQWEKELFKRKYLILLSVIFLIVSAVLYHYVGLYVDTVARGLPADIIIDNTKSIDLGFLYGPGLWIVFAILLLYPLFFQPKNLHIVIFQMAILNIVRDIFLCLTPMLTPLDTTYLITAGPAFFSFQNDLFFSGHTAFAFLGFWLFKDKKIKWFFLAATIILASTVMLMHAHYTIDIFAALFITYGVYKFGNWVFNRKKKQK